MRAHNTGRLGSVGHRAFAAAAALLALNVPRACAQGVFELHRLAAGVYAAEVVAQPAAYAFANSLVVIGADGVLVVDTQQSTAAAQSLIDAIRKLTPAPVRWVVNTHWHGDHVNGNQAYALAFPGVQFIGHESIANDMRTLGAARRATERNELPVQIAAGRRMLLEGTGSDGAALSAAERQALERRVALREAYNTDLAQLTPIEPTLTVEDRLELTVGEHRVLLLHAGPAHTRGDLIVVLPDHGIAAVGDLVEAGMPYFDDAYPRGWLQAVERISALTAQERDVRRTQPMILLPSHGGITRDATLVDDARRLLTLILELSWAPPLSESAVAETVAFRELERHWAMRYGVASRAFRAGVRTAVARARLEAESR